MALSGLYLLENLYYEGNVNELVHLHHNTEPYTSASVTVKQNQLVYICSEGKIENVFSEGRHCLNSDNSPIHTEILYLLGSGKQSLCNLNTYFVNTSQQKALFGIPDITFRLRSEEYKDLPITVGVSGAIYFRISDAEKLLTDIVIPNAVKMLDSDELLDWIGGEVKAYIKGRFIDMIQSRSLDLFDLDRSLVCFGDELYEDIEEYFTDYGLELLKIEITDSSKSESYHMVRNDIEKHILARNQLDVICDSMDEIEVRGISIHGKKRSELVWK